jgi:hypothetical protein
MYARCLAVCCSVLQCVAVCCSESYHIIPHHTYIRIYTYDTSPTTPICVCWYVCVSVGVCVSVLTHKHTLCHTSPTTSICVCWYVCVSVGVCVSVLTHKHRLCHTSPTTPIYTYDLTWGCMATISHHTCLYLPYDEQVISHTSSCMCIVRGASYPVVWFEIPLVVEIEIPRYKSRYFVYTCMIHQRYYERVISPTCGGLRVSIWGIWRGNV